MRAVEKLLQDTILNNTLSSLRRGYAVYALTMLWHRNKIQSRHLVWLSERFTIEEDGFVRLVLAVCLINITKQQTRAEWFEELIPYLIQGKKVSPDFYHMQPFMGDTDAQEYLAKVIQQAHPAMLRKYTEPVFQTFPISTRHAS